MLQQAQAALITANGVVMASAAIMVAWPVPQGFSVKIV